MTTQPHTDSSAHRAAGYVEPTSVNWRHIGLFMLISYGLFALFAAPFWVLPGGVGHPRYNLVIGIGMWTPAIASLIVAKLVEKTSWRTRVGLRFRGKWGRVLLWSVLAVLIVWAVHFISTAIMVLRGVPGDLTGGTWLSGTIQTLSESTGAPVSATQAIITTFLGALMGLLITSVLALGEEIGWRGWLWPALKPLGTLRAAVVGGIIWSLWHLPIVLIGHNYAGHNRMVAVLIFILPCIGMSLLFGAITDRAGGNPIPAAFAHGAFNAQFGLIVMIMSAPGTETANLLIDTSLGVTGAVVLFLVGLLVALPDRASWIRPQRRS